MSSSAAALPKDQLLEKLVELGDKTGQYTSSKPEDTDLIIEHKVVDTEYYRVAGKEKIVEIYRAYILLDEETHEAKYNEELSKGFQDAGINVGRGSVGFSGSKSLFRGKVIGMKERGIVYGIKKDDLTFGKVADFSFDVQNFRKPIEELLNANGWKLSQVTLRKDATYPKKKKFGWI